MLLTIHYKSGEKRIVHLTKDFFQTDTILNRKTKRVERVMTPSDKAMELAWSLNSYPHIVILERGGTVQMKKIIHSNEPVPVEYELKVDEKKVKKAWRNLYKNVPLNKLTL